MIPPVALIFYYSRSSLCLHLITLLFFFQTRRNMKALTIYDACRSTERIQRKGYQIYQGLLREHMELAHGQCSITCLPRIVFHRWLSICMTIGFFKDTTTNLLGHEQYPFFGLVSDVYIPYSVDSLALLGSNSIGMDKMCKILDRVSYLK